MGVVARYCLCLWLSLLLAGCVTSDLGEQPLPARSTGERVQALKITLLSIPGIQAGVSVEQEAQRIAEAAVLHAKFLSQQYNVSSSPRWHNSLVNLGLKERGLCYHFAHDLKAELAKMHLTHFHVIDLAARHTSRMRAHYAIAIGVPGSTFGDHIVLDAWRDSGQLFWSRVEEDERYPWALWQ